MIYGSTEDLAKQLAVVSVYDTSDMGREGASLQ